MVTTLGIGVERQVHGLQDASGARHPGPSYLSQVALPIGASQSHSVKLRKSNSKPSGKPSNCALSWQSGWPSAQLEIHAVQQLRESVFPYGLPLSLSGVNKSLETFQRRLCDLNRNGFTRDFRLRPIPGERVGVLQRVWRCRWTAYRPHLLGLRRYRLGFPWRRAFLLIPCSWQSDRFPRHWCPLLY